MARSKKSTTPKNVVVLMEDSRGVLDFLSRFATVDEAKAYIADYTRDACDDEFQAYFIAPVAYKVSVTRKTEVTLAEESI